MDRAVLVYTTFPPLVEAEAAGLVPGFRFPLRGNHSYELPAVVAIALECVDRDYFS